MPVFTTTKNYADNTSLTQAMLDAAFQSIETFINTTKLDSVNIQSGAISSTLLAPNAVTSSAVSSKAIVYASLADEVVAKLVPTGTVCAYAASTAPSTGWLLCDGTAVSRTTYSALFGVVGVKHGYGDNSTTFNLPDYRGRFLRGLDGAASRDPDNSTRTAMATGGTTGNDIGSVQGGATKRPNTALTTDNPGDHQHTYATNNASAFGGSSGYAVNGGSGGTAFNYSTGVGGSHTHTVTGGGDSETRPINAYVNFIIKY